MKPVFSITRPEDYHASLMQMLEDTSAVVKDVMLCLILRDIDPVGMSITMRQIDAQLTRIKNEVASAIGQMDVMMFVGDDVFELYEMALAQRNALLAWIVVQHQQTDA